MAMKNDSENQWTMLELLDSSLYVHQSSKKSQVIQR